MNWLHALPVDRAIIEWGIEANFCGDGRDGMEFLWRWVRVEITSTETDGDGCARAGVSRPFTYLSLDVSSWLLLSRDVARHAAGLCRLATCFIHDQDAVVYFWRHYVNNQRRTPGGHSLWWLCIIDVQVWHIGQPWFLLTFSSAHSVQLSPKICATPKLKWFAVRMQWVLDWKLYAKPFQEDVTLTLYCTTIINYWFWRNVIWCSTTSTLLAT